MAAADVESGGSSRPVTWKDWLFLYVVMFGPSVAVMYGTNVNDEPLTTVLAAGFVAGFGLLPALGVWSAKGCPDLHGGFRAEPVVMTALFVGITVCFLLGQCILWANGWPV